MTNKIKLNKKIKDNVDSMELCFVPEKDIWRQRELYAAVVKYIISKEDNLKVSLQSIALKMGGVSLAIYDATIYPTHDHIPTIGMAGLAWIVATVYQDNARTNLDEARAEYVSTRNRFDTWRFTQDKEGYEIPKPRSDD